MIKNTGEYKNTPMYEGLKQLNDYLLKESLPSYKFNVIGGFAMICHNLRQSGITDVDYIGPDFPEKLTRKIDEIGERLGLGHGWINNDCLLSGTTLEDFELTTGKLTFHHAFSLEKISVDILDKKDLLRLKVIAVDTSLSALEFGGEFTRIKDLPDIGYLMDDLGYDLLSLELDTYMYNISEDTYETIEKYLKTRDLGETLKYVEDRQ